MANWVNHVAPLMPFFPGRKPFSPSKGLPGLFLTDERTLELFFLFEIFSKLHSEFETRKTCNESPEAIKTARKIETPLNNTSVVTISSEDEEEEEKKNTHNEPSYFLLMPRALSGISGNLWKGDDHRTKK
ncbi:hypothetical protein RUM44_004766 [Polyplax serrata]|uniref:Uncharacterized protein n=1 Tax=Polyplax serrata TaxID=468196 RepID=A0ABR1B5I3_POLSC